MTKNQLNIFFEHFFLEKDYSSDAILQLKKVVLLELKSSEDDMLLVAGVAWTKQDLLAFFDSPLDESDFDLNRFYVLHPWVSAIEDPVAIEFSSGLTRYEVSADDAMFDEFRMKYAHMHQERFLSELRKRFIARDDLGVYALLCFQNAFSESFRFEVFVSLASLMLNRFDLTINAIKTSAEQDNLFRVHYMNHNVYFILMNKLSQFDSELPRKSLMVLTHAINGAPIADALQLIRLQSSLDLNPMDAELLDKMEKSIAFQKRKQNARIALFLFILAIIITAAILR